MGLIFSGKLVSSQIFTVHEHQNKTQIVKNKSILFFNLAILILFDIEYITVSSSDIMEESLNRRTSASIGKTWNMSSV